MIKRQLAYCTNVHAGADLDQTIANLRLHALAVKQRIARERPMGVGLWLAAPAARMLRDRRNVAQFAQWLRDHDLIPFTLNGFPYGDFHQPVVKYRVYQPTWFEPSRLEYTKDLITILDAILPPDMEGSISTLPIAWRKPVPSRAQMLVAAQQLRQVVDFLRALEARTGRLIYVCLEPEPGCILQVADDVTRFFDEFLLTDGDEQSVRRHLRVCHDVCHAAVMFEDQHDVFAKYAERDIRVGKVQVSSAVRVDFGAVPQSEQEAALTQLESFAEDRYLHQTVVRAPGDAQPHFYDDLPGPAIDMMERVSGQGLLNAECRVHFHVPVYLGQFGAIGTTQNHIRQCLDQANQVPELSHFEVETYAWNVLPVELQHVELANGIARELQWVSELPEFGFEESKG